jgi:hypothetical protein
MKMEPIHSSKMTLITYKTTWCHNPKAKYTQLLSGLCIKRVCEYFRFACVCHRTKIMVFTERRTELDSLPKSIMMFKRKK